MFHGDNICSFFSKKRYLDLVQYFNDLHAGSLTVFLDFYAVVFISYYFVSTLVSRV